MAAPFETCLNTVAEVGRNKSSTAVPAPAAARKTGLTRIDSRALASSHSRLYQFTCVIRLSSFA